VQPAPAPRFSRTKPELPTAPEPHGHGTERALAEWGIEGARIVRLREAGVIGVRDHQERR